MVLYTEVDGIYHRWYCSVPKHAVCCLGELELKQVPFFGGAVEVSLLVGNQERKNYVHFIHFYNFPNSTQ